MLGKQTMVKRYVCLNSLHASMDMRIEQNTIWAGAKVIQKITNLQHLHGQEKLEEE